jgi:MFS family permease
MQDSLSERSLRYYGWAIAASLALTELTSWGILFYSFSVMVTPMHMELGWSAGTITSAFAEAFLVAGISAVFVGRWIDRFGARLVMTSGSVIAVIMLVLWSQVSNPVEFYSIWGGLGVASSMVFYEPAFAATALWFSHLRRQALTVVTIGGALASVVFVPVATGLVLQFGWRSALLDLAVILGVVTIPLHLGIIRRPKQGPMQTPAANESLPVKQIVRYRGFWRMTAAFALGIFIWLAMTSYLIPYLLTHGYAPTFAAGIFSLMGASQIIGRLLLLVVHRWFGDRWTVPLFFMLQATGLGVLMGAATTWQVGLFALLFGTGFGGSYPARATLVADRYGTKGYGQINGLITFVMTLTAAAGLLGLGQAAVRLRTYDGLIGIALVGSLLAVAAIISLEVFSPRAREQVPVLPQE